MVFEPTEEQALTIAIYNRKKVTEMKIKIGTTLRNKATGEIVKVQLIHPSTCALVINGKMIEDLRLLDDYETFK